MKPKPIPIYVSLILFFITIIITSVYFLLGGFEEVKVYEMAGEERLVAGRHYIGPSSSKIIKTYFEESRALVLDSAIHGTLTVIAYNNDSIPSREAEYFIGITLCIDITNGS